MPINQNFIDKFVDVTSRAALASYHFVGKKDKRVVQVDAKFYQSVFAKHFNVVQKLVKENM